MSPAHAQVSADWTGTNTGGSTITWHWVATSDITSTTTFDEDSYTVAAAGSFAHELTTTAEFVDPSGPSVFSPGSGGSYRGFFETDTPVGYSIAAQLNRRGRVRLSSFEGLEVFDQSNHTDTTIFVNLAGTIPPGHYQFLATVGTGVQNLFPGEHHIEDSGSFKNLTYTVQVPEPQSLAAGMVISAFSARTCWRRRLCART